MSTLAFDHILNLSFAWHTRRKTGEVLRVLDRGAAINHTFEVRGTFETTIETFILMTLPQLILFNIIPTFVDIFIALCAFCYFFGWSLALVISVVMFAYGKYLDRTSNPARSCHLSRC